MPILACNYPPSILGADPATWRRLVAVPWEVTVSEAEQDASLGERIRTQELDGVLDWLLHGYDNYCALGLADPPMAVVQATMALREDLTVRDQWYAERTEQDETYWASTQDLWEQPPRLGAVSGINPERLGDKPAFTRWLGSRPGLTAKKSQGQRGWAGVQLVKLDYYSGDLNDFADHG